MEKYKLFTKEPIKAIEDIILPNAISLALEKLADNLEKNNSTIMKEEVIKNIPILIYNGMILLRRKNEEGKKLYELFHGCILAAFLNTIEYDFQYCIYYPEDQSYDFLIIKYSRGKTADFKFTDNKEVYKNTTMLKVELTELTKLEDLEKIIADKLRYIKRILLISIAYHGELNFQDIFNKASDVNKNNFETIWLIGQTDHPEKKNKLCYFLAELVKHKEVYLFELPIDLSKIENELKKALGIIS
jgi:hypothetical protein